MTSRYAQMVSIVERERPSVIVEVGVHRAVRATMLCEAVLQTGHACRYIGYDVFETKSVRFQEDALNGKGMAFEDHARSRLDSVKRKFPAFSYKFIIGDTRETLHGKTVEADFAFIDGDHRVEAIRGDYEACRMVKTVVFDDYYLMDDNGQIVDTSRYGANEIVKHIDADLEILPLSDPVKHGGVVRLAVVRRKQ